MYFWCTLARVCGGGHLHFCMFYFFLQCVEYFQEWSLNPLNYAFDEIRKGKWYDFYIV